MVGLVVVSHSHLLAQGVGELAEGMAGGEVRLAVTGGLDEPGHPLGTDAVAVAAAIEQVWSPDGVLVLMDLGSAVLSAEMALDLLGPDRRHKVLLCEAPLVEGMVAAVVQARLGGSLEEVAAEARRALDPKTTQLGTAPHPPSAETPTAPAEASIRLVVTNPMGLHARPAVRFVETVAHHDAQVVVRNLTTGAGPGSGRSLNAVATLGVRQGHEIEVAASGAQAHQVLAALETLARDGFGEPPQTRIEQIPPQPGRAAPRGEGLTGLAVSPGIAIGPARHLRVTPLPIPVGPADAPEEEWEALAVAREETRRDLTARRADLATRAGEYPAAILDAHLLFLTDEELVEPARRLIFEEGESAARAWERVVRAMEDRYRALEDEYQRTRAVDVAAVGEQVLRHLLGVSEVAVEGSGIVVAEDLTPAQTASFDPEEIRGLALAGGGPTSHAAILARSLGLPAVMGLGRALMEVAEGTFLVVDGARGVVEVAPSEAVVADYRRLAAEREVEQRRVRAQAREPAITLDGRHIEVVANIGSPAEVNEAVAAGAEGVGLLRTEFLFLDRTSPPDENEQESVYRAIAEGLDGRSLVIRTIDVGGDKPLPYLPAATEANPFLGVRGLRLGLAEPEMLKTQLRAIFRVGFDHPVKVMFPMVATVDEVVAARALLTEAAGEIGRRGMEALARTEVGVMVEIPSAALLARWLAPEIDFFSIGTNDLTQYTLAAERGNPALAHLSDPLHPSVLRLIAEVCEAARDHRRWVGVCGELAADPVAVPFLIGLGVSELSVAAPAIPAIKQTVRRTGLDEARRLATAALGLPSAEAVRESLPATG